MKRARGVAALNGKVYAIGGRTPAGDTVATNEVYDPVNNTWTALASPNRFAGIC
jgi:Kelch motif